MFRIDNSKVFIMERQRNYKKKLMKTKFTVCCLNLNDYNNIIQEGCRIQELNLINAM